MSGPDNDKDNEKDKTRNGDGEKARARKPRPQVQKGGRDTHRLKRLRAYGMKPPIEAHGDQAAAMKENYALNCGWGRLVFGQTFAKSGPLIASLGEELPERRDIAIYVRDPHVLLAEAPQEIFLDPSHTYRLNLSTYRPSPDVPRAFFVRRLTSRFDADAINRIYAARNMVTVPPDFFWSMRDMRALNYFVAEDDTTGEILGTVTGVDHTRAFNDPERGSSLWCLAVDPQARQPGVGEALVRRLAEHFAARGASFMDLSVIHSNTQAIDLYEKLGFARVPFFSVKRKNPINEKLFTGPEAYDSLNPYARIIVDEARRRGIHVEVTDAEGGFFRLTHGGSSVLCRESLSDRTSAVAMSICSDKAVTRRIVEKAGVSVPDQISGDCSDDALSAFIERHGEVVVKPAQGEQGAGVTVGLSGLDETRKAIEDARSLAGAVLVEACIAGEDLRLVVINFRVVAAAIRRPAMITGDGRSTARELIEKQSRRRAAATGGESRIPLDEETARSLAGAGYGFDDVPEDGKRVQVRKTANLHTGGTIHDVTGEVHPALVDAAVRAARAIDIPVTGIDFMVKSPRKPDYAFIEANERPGLANHEPQPTAERFIDLLFPLSVPAAMRRAAQTQTEKSTA